MYGTGPAAHAESFDKQNRFNCSRLLNTATEVSAEEFESDSVHKQSCQMVTDEGYEVTYRVGKDMLYKVDSITCHETSVRKL